MATTVLESNHAYLITTVDAARARLFWVEEDWLRNGWQMREDEGAALVHPTGRIKEGDRYTDSFPGGVNRGYRSAQSQGYDDHREANDQEERRRFAREVVDAIAKALAARGTNRLVLVASHSQYSAVAEELSKRLPNVQLRHCIAEMTRLDAPALHEALRARELVP